MNQLISGIIFIKGMHGTKKMNARDMTDKKSFRELVCELTPKDIIINPATVHGVTNLYKIEIGGYNKKLNEKECEELKQNILDGQIGLNIKNIIQREIYRINKQHKEYKKFGREHWAFGGCSDCQDIKPALDEILSKAEEMIHE
jgi:hypothetical protein